MIIQSGWTLHWATLGEGQRVLGKHVLEGSPCAWQMEATSGWTSGTCGSWSLCLASQDDMASAACEEGVPDERVPVLALEALTVWVTFVTTCKETLGVCVCSLDSCAQVHTAVRGIHDHMRMSRVCACVCACTNSLSRKWGMKVKEKQNRMRSQGRWGIPFTKTTVKQMQRTKSSWNSLKT